MKTYIHITNTKQYSLPAVYQNDDIRYPESLVEHFLEQYTQAGNIVFDPFAGFGTTIASYSPSHKSNILRGARHRERR